MTIIISADDIKKTLPKYRADQAEKFHQQSAKEADRQFYESLKENTEDTVTLMCGGAASGKTEFLATHLEDPHHQNILFDTTLSSIEGARIKIEKIEKQHKTPIIYFVVPDDLRRAHLAFLHRDRKFGDQHFYKTHSGARKTILWVIEHHPEVSIHLIESSYGSAQFLKFRQLHLSTKASLKKHIQDMQLAETDILHIVTKK